MSSSPLRGALRRFATITCAASLSIAPAFAQNDECSGALPLSDGLNGPFSNTTATNNPADPAFTCGGTASAARDLWFSYTAAFTGLGTFETCGIASFDTRMAGYSGACGALTLIQCNDDTAGCSGFTSRLSFGVTGGTTYLIRVAGFSSSTGSFSIRASNTLPDECAQALTIVNGSNGPFSNVGATTSAPVWSCGPGGSDIWLRYVATCTGSATADLCASTFDTMVEAFSGTCAALSLIGCNDDACGLRSSVSFPVTNGQTYFLRVGGFLGASGTISVGMSCSGIPSNDECAGALTLTLGANGPFTSALSTTGSLQACGIGSNDVWFRYTAPCTADFSFETCSSNFDTVIELFSGSCASPTSITCNDDDCGLQSRVSATLTQNQTYYLLVGGFSGQTGTVNITVSGGLGYANDECTGALPLGVGVNEGFTTVGATTSTVPGPFSCVSSGCDAWHSFTAPCNGDWVFDTCGSGFDTALQLYTGTCGALSSVACNDDSCGLQSRVSLAGMTTGQTVYLRVGGFNSRQGSYQVRVSLTGNVGSFSTVSTGCGGLTLTASGAPTLAGSVDYTLSGSSGTTYLWFGSAIGPIAICPPEPCAIGADFGIVITGSTVSLSVPCDVSIIGGSLACQGADIVLLPGVCPAGEPFTVNFSDTVITTIN